jgi:hypothetical protein
MVRDHDGRIVMKSDAQHLGVGFFLEPSTGVPCLMLGMNAFKKAQNGSELQGYGHRGS